MRNGLFGLTQQSWSFVKDIKPGMPLFLYNLSEKKFQGVFEAVSTHPMHRARAPAPCPPRAPDPHALLALLLLAQLV